MQPRLEIRRILVPLDGSILAEAALPLVEQLARDHAAEVVLLQVLKGQRTREAELEEERKVGAYLEGTVARLQAHGLGGVFSRIWFGEADQAIANATAREQVDLVAMSTHGRGGRDRLRFGSVAESVVRRAPVPVLLVRGIAAWARDGIGRILVPLDGSDASEAVLPIVACLAGPFDFAVQLLHVVEATQSLPGAPAGATGVHDPETEAAYLARMAASLEARGLRVGTTVRAGLPADVIPAVTAEANCGLVAMSTHGRSGLGRLFLGSVAERVLRSVSVPMLLWKPPVGTRESGPARP